MVDVRLGIRVRDVVELKKEAVVAEVRLFFYIFFDLFFYSCQSMIKRQ